MDLPVLCRTVLFKGMTEDEVSCALLSLQAKTKDAKKGRALLHAGDFTDDLGLVLAGSVTIEGHDVWGNRVILGHVVSGEIFAEAYALLDEPLQVDVIANEDCRVLFLHLGSAEALAGCTASWASKFTANLLTVTSRKNLHLAGRSFHTAPKTVRGRVMSYLNAVSLQAQSRDFTIPFDRQQLADYLNVGANGAFKGTGKDAEGRSDQNEKESLSDPLKNLPAASAAGRNRFYLFFFPKMPEPLLCSSPMVSA